MLVERLSGSRCSAAPGCSTCCSRCRSSRSPSALERWLFFARHADDVDALAARFSEALEVEDFDRARQSPPREPVARGEHRPRRRCAGSTAGPRALADALDASLARRAREAPALDVPARHARQQRALRRPPRHGHRRHRGLPPARRRGPEQGGDGQRDERHRRGARRDRRRASSSRSPRSSPTTWCRRGSPRSRPACRSSASSPGRYVEARERAGEPRCRTPPSHRTPSRPTAPSARRRGAAPRRGAERHGRHVIERSGGAHRRDQRHPDGRRGARAPRHHDGVGDVHRAAEPQGGAAEDGHVRRGGELARRRDHHARRRLLLRRQARRRAGSS